jgi:chromosome segregation ATPase
VTKEHRLQQHAALESKLEHLKYSNGELRAQLRQSREILSCGTRELGTRRLAAGRAGDDIRDFERKLKKGLNSVRMITACRRKIDSLIIVVENKEAVLVRLKAEAKDKLNVFEKKMREAQRHEQMLQTAVQQEVARAQTFAEEVATLRAENTQLEQEMLEAQNMEESTRLREATVEAQIASERKRHQELAAQLTVQIENCQNADQKATSEQEIVTKELKEEAQELHNAKQCIANYQQEEGHNPSPVSADPQESVPLFNRKRLAMRLEAETNAARAQAASNDALRQSIKQLRIYLKKIEEETYHNKSNASCLSASSRDKKATEVVRRGVLETFQKDLERDREDACKLEKSSKDLEKVRAQETSRHSQLVSECEAAIQKDREATETAKRDLATESAAAEKNITSWENEKSEICRRVEEAKDRAKATEKSLDNLAENTKGLEVENETGFKEKMREINESKEAHGEKTNGQISRLLQSKLKRDYRSTSPEYN